MENQGISYLKNGNFYSFLVFQRQKRWQEVLSVWNSLIKWSNWPVGLGAHVGDNQEAAEFIAMKDEESKNQMWLNQK